MQTDYERLRRNSSTIKAYLLLEVKFTAFFDTSNLGRTNYIVRGALLKFLASIT